ncbi:hypothetical protein PIB30_033145 [Stylosanthes scabra]|uniref:Uncharacterized protein n=1 Tax=Stylosanthes scabra TaxID=79078 RepID=A0ABU6XBJ7_9FABA|nr:hypothetical protein [Stylosanthes scabra]
MTGRFATEASVAKTKLVCYGEVEAQDDASTPRCNVCSLSSASMSISREEEARTSSSESSSLTSFSSIGVPFLQFPPYRGLRPSSLRMTERVPNSASALIS